MHMCPWSHRSTRLVPLAFVLGLLSPASSSQTVRLNDPFHYEAVVGDVQDFVVKPNGNFVFFRADARRAGVMELFTVPAAGGAAPFRENLKLPPDRLVFAYQTTAIGNWIVFAADQDENDVGELYSRRPGDLAPRPLTPDLVSGGDVAEFALTPDGTRVVFRADREVDGRFELYVTAIDGTGEPVKVSGALVADGDVSSAFLVNATSTRVVYVADALTDEVQELFSAPLNGGSPPVRLNGPLVADGDVFQPNFLLPSPMPIAISADGATVVYMADQDQDEVFELFRVPTNGSAGAVQVHPALVAGADVAEFQLSHDAERVVYVVQSPNPATNGKRETYSAPLDGSAVAVKLNTDAQPATLVAISPDSSRVVMTDYYPRPRVLLSAPIDGGSAPVVLEDDVIELRDAAISPDSSRVVYWTGYGCQGSCFNYEALRSVPIDGGASPARLDPGGTIVTLDDFRTRTPFAFSADSSRVVFRWGTPQLGLYSAPVDGGAPALALTTLEVAPVFAAGPAGSRAFFLADVAGTDVFELHSVSLTDGTGLVKLSGALARDTFADVNLPGAVENAAQAFRNDATGERVVFSADPTVDQEFELFTVRADGRAAAIPLPSDPGISRFELDPTEERVVYLVPDPSSPVGAGEIYSMPADGGASPVKLNPALPGSVRVLDFQIGADGARVVFRTGTSPNFVAGLHSVPLEGGTSVLLSGGQVWSYVLSPSGDRVAFVQTQGGGLALYSALLDGSSAPVQLYGPVSDVLAYFSTDGNHVVVCPWPRTQHHVAPADGSAPPLLATGTVSVSSAPVFTPDGAWIVFAGRESATPDVVELFKTPIDASLAPVKLNTPMVTGGDVFTLFSSTVLVSPDSSRVVYVADQDTNDVFELYSVPLDLSASPVKLSGTLVAGGDVTVYDGVAPLGMKHVAISPDGERVVYVADQETDEVLELYSVPIDGSAGPVKLSGAMVADGNVAAEGQFLPQPYPVRSFQVAPDSTRVVYAADQETDGLFELFLAPIDGSLAPVKLNRPLARNGVSFFDVTADARRVVYEATERSNVTELFESVLTFDPHRRNLASPEENRRP